MANARQLTRHRHGTTRRPATSGQLTRVAVASAGVAIAAAVVNAALARRAEEQNPPIGHFVEVDGLPVHYVERGRGTPLVLLHGNASMIEDFVTSGLIDDAAARYRVIAFDRPGYGHTARPRGKVWTAIAQATLVSKALRLLGVRQAMVLGHSRGAQVAAAMALRPRSLATGLVLVSGYYYPTLRGDTLLAAPTATPLLGDVLSWTTAPLFSRAMWPAALHKMFDPARIPEKFNAFPTEMVFRPRQLRANAAEGVLTFTDAFALYPHYRELTVPTAIAAGAGDRLINPDHQSLKLHRELPQSILRRVRGVGHMVHQNATAELLAITDAVAERVERNQMTSEPSIGANPPNIDTADDRGLVVAD